MDEHAGKLRSAREDLAALHRIAEILGWNESVVNHLTLMVPGTQDQYLVIPYGLHWREVIASDFLVVDFSGNVLSGNGRPETSAVSLHGPIHRHVPQAKCVLHTHQPNVTALTALANQRLMMIHQDAMMFSGITTYLDSYEDLPLDSSAGEIIASKFGAALVMLMANHGPMVVGETAAKAFQTLYYLDRLARIQIHAMSANVSLKEIDPDIVKKMGGIVRSIYLGHEAELHFAAQKRLLDVRVVPYNA